MKFETVDSIRRHYEHACSKHPKLCDRLVCEYDRTYAWENLARWRDRLLLEPGLGKTSATNVLQCEVAELIEAMSRDSVVDTQEEALDCIAVLLRILDEVSQ